MIDLNRLGFFAGLVLFAVVAFMMGHYWARATAVCPPVEITIEGPAFLEDCALVFAHPSLRGHTLMYDCEEVER